MNESLASMSYSYETAMNAHPERRWGTALAMIALALFAGAVFLGRVPPRFQAAARIRVQRLDPRNPDNSYYPEGSTVSLSDVLVSNAIETLGLRQKWGERHGNGRELDSAEAARMFLQRVELSRVLNSVTKAPTALTEIRVTDERPSQAAQIANAIAESIRNEILAKSQQTVSTAASSLESNWEQQWSEREQKIQEVRNKLNALRIELRISEYATPDPDSDPEKLRSFNELSRTLARLQADLHDFKTNITRPEIVNKVTLTVAEIADRADPPTQPIWPSRTLRSGLFGSAAVLGVAGLASLTIPQWLSGRKKKQS